MITIANAPLANNPTKFIGPFNDPQGISARPGYSTVTALNGPDNGRYLSIQPDGSYQYRDTPQLFEEFKVNGLLLVCCYGKDSSGNYHNYGDPSNVINYEHVIPMVAA